MGEHVVRDSEEGKNLVHLPEAGKNLKARIPSSKKWQIESPEKLEEETQIDFMRNLITEHLKFSLHLRISEHLFTSRRK